MPRPLFISGEERNRLLDAANRLLHCRPLAEQAVRQALASCQRSPDQDPAVLTEQTARAYAAAYRKALPHGPAAPAVRRKRLSPAADRRRYALAAAGFAVLDVVAIALAAEIFLWSRMFLEAPAPQPIGVSQEPSQPRAGLDSLFYALSEIPDGFRRVGHLYSATSAEDHYADGRGNLITFIQQVSPEPVTGFDPAVGYEPVAFRGHAAAFLSRDGVQELYWFNEYYCYTLSTTLPREAALSLAQSAQIGADRRTLQKIPLGDLPLLYTPRLAAENGDVQTGIYGEKNTGRIGKFVKSWAGGVQDAIRVCAFGEDGSLIITDLETANGRLYCASDTRRSAAGPWQERGAEYSSARISRQDGGYALILENSGDAYTAALYGGELG